MNSSILPLTVALLATNPLCAADTIRVLIWDEQQAEQKQAYGDKFLGETIAAHLREQPGISVKTVTMSSPDQGLDAATIDATDVLIWWGHRKHVEVGVAGVERVVARVQAGKMSLIALHSAHWSRPFVRLMQERAKSDALATLPSEERSAKLQLLNEQCIGVKLPGGGKLTPALEKTKDGAWQLTLPACVFPSWRADAAASHVTTLLPDHPLAAGLPAKWDIPHTEMYSEPFHVPKPDAVVFEERWDLGEHFRSGSVWQVGQGRVFYFRPGHETYPVYKQAEPLRVMLNAVNWLGRPVAAK